MSCSSTSGVDNASRFRVMLRYKSRPVAVWLVGFFNSYVTRWMSPHGWLSLNAPDAVNISIATGSLTPTLVRPLPTRKPPDKILLVPFVGVTAHRSEEHTSELPSLRHLVCRLLLVKRQQPD